MEVTLYTTHCPKCKILENKMLNKGIKFEVVDDVEKVVALGFMQSPMLKVDEEIMDFVTANTWVNGWGNK